MKRAPPGPNSSVSSSERSSLMSSAGPASVMVREFSWSNTPSSDRLHDTCSVCWSELQTDCVLTNVRNQLQHATKMPSSTALGLFRGACYLEASQHEPLLGIIDAHELGATTFAEDTKTVSLPAGLQLRTQGVAAMLASSSRLCMGGDTPARSRVPSAL